MTKSTSRELTYRRGDHFKHESHLLPLCVLAFFLTTCYTLLPKLLVFQLPYISSYKHLAILFIGLPGFCFAIFLNLFYFYCYWSEKNYIEQYKVTNVPWPWKEDPKKWKKDLKSLLTTYLTNYILLGSPVISITIRMCKPNYSLDEMPSPFTFIMHIVFAVICEDFFNYWFHRTVHLPIFYKRIHKKHHEYYNTLSLVCIYAHPIEFVFGNVFPALSSIWILKSNMHAVTESTWLMLRLFYTHDVHSGYDFPFSLFRAFPFHTTSVYHNYHHLKNNGNYGSLTRTWDAIFGTNLPYLEEQKELLKDYRKNK